MSKVSKVAAFAVIGGLAVGLPSLAMAADFVTVQCSIFNPRQPVFASQASAGVTLPPSCAAGPSCSQCVADVLSNGFKLANSFNVSGADTYPGYIGSYFVFTRREGLL